ncbi:MAG: hypothetical protein WAW23_04880, partial [Candidatus Methanoperedens sp.]
RIDENSITVSNLAVKNPIAKWDGGAVNGGSVSNVTLLDPDYGTAVNVSNTQGDKYGNYGGYLDFMLSDGQIFGNVLKGVYAVFPEGLGVRSLPDRFNLSKMSPGYYFVPFSGSGNLIGLWADLYEITAMPKFCKTTSGAKSYIFLFDQYGRYTADSRIDEGNADWNNNFGITLCNYSRIPMRFYQGGDCNWQFASNGLFVPPQCNAETTTNGYSKKFYNNSCKTFYILAYDIIGGWKEIFTCSYQEHVGYPKSTYNMFNWFQSDLHGTLPVPKEYLTAQSSEVVAQSEIVHAEWQIVTWFITYDTVENITKSIGWQEFFGQCWFTAINARGYWETHTASTTTFNYTK